MAEITSLVINFNGSNNSTNFIDETGKIITPVGSTVISTTQSKFGGSSGYFNGGGYLDVASSSNFLMSADFTVELWVYTDPSTAAWSRLIENEQYNVTGGWHFSYNGYDSSGNRRLGFQLGLTGGGGSRIDSNSAIPTNQWVHIAVTRYNNVIRMFVNGVQQTATLTTAESFSSPSLRIGATLGTPSSYFTGYIDSIQIIKNRALYSENFTVPIEQPQYDPYYNDYTSLLIPFDGPNNSTVFGDYSLNRNIITAYGDAKISTTQSKFGGSSGYFNANTDKLLLLDNSNLSLAGDFTIESWVYITGTGDFTIYGSASSIGNEGFLLFARRTAYSNHVRFYDYKTGTGVSGTTVIPLNTWAHVACVRSGTTVTIYLNGVYECAMTCSTVFNRISECYVGGNSSSVYGAFGYIDEFRLTNGVARYTGNFTVPSQSFYKPYNYDPFLDKVSLLLHMDGDNNSTIFRDSSANNASITAFGNSKISTTQSKIGGASGYFDGTGDYITTIYSSIYQLYQLEDDNFTLECWVYPLVSNTRMGFCATRPATANNGWLYDIRDDNTVVFAYTGGSSVQSTGTVSSNTWTHLAVVRSGTNVTHYINGVASGSGTVSNGTISTSSVLIIGEEKETPSTYYFNGYIDELRITKGVARYTTDFTPPAYRFYDLIDQIEYFYGVYDYYLTCKPGESLGDPKNNSIIYIDNNLYFDTVDYGEINIYGYYKIDKNPVHRKIRLCTYPNHFIIRETWSDPITGLYSFNNVKKQDYILIFEDYENLHHSKIRRLFMDQM